MANRTTHADALHHAGRWQESATAFREAEEMQAERQPQYPQLYSLWGYRYCDLLLSKAEPEGGSGLDGIGEKSPLDPPFFKGGKPEAATRYHEGCEEVSERARESLQIVLRGSKNLLDIALNHLSLGRAHLGLTLTSQADFSKAAGHLHQAVDGLRQAARDDHLPRGLLARVALRRLRAAHTNGDATADLDAAATDLHEAQEIAERGHMRLHEADAHLEWTRLHLQTGDPNAAREHLERARELVTACGYGRREREVAWLQGQLDASSTA